MNEVIAFENKEFGEIRTLTIEKEPYFVGKDVAEILGYTNPQKAIRDHVDEEDKTLNESFTVNGTKGILINESGLYSLILSSKLPKAKNFKRWVTSEVLPSIRKNGYYSMQEDEKRTKLEIQKQRANAMELNAKTRAFHTLINTIEKHKNLSPIAVEVFGLKALEGAFGVDVGNYLPTVEKTYTAKAVGKMLGISAKKVGMIANEYDLKTAEYGIFVLDKSQYCEKQVESFRYNQKAVEVIQKICEEKKEKAAAK